MINDLMINATCMILNWSWVALFLVWPVGQCYWFMNDQDRRKAKDHGCNAR